MGLWAELRRRNVIRMAGLYLVGAWIVVQVASTLLPIFEAPGWVLKTLVALLTLGFVPALVFSWVYELTPEGLKRDADVSPAESIASRTSQRMDRLIVAGIFVLVVLVLANRLWPSHPPQAPETAAAAQSPAPMTTGVPTASAPTPAADATPSIAVLPFVNMSADADNQYFSDGISEELLNVLVRVEGIGVASRTSSFAYKGRELGAAQIAKELKVNHILEGSVRKSGKQVRITAQLIDAVHDRHLWSETYDRELTDIFKIQDEIANAIVAALRGSLGKGQAERAVTVKADTQNLDAYAVYLKSRALFVTRSDVRESIRLAEQVVRMDPKFARGWELLAAAYAAAPSWLEHDRDYKGLTIAAAKHALELDPSLSMPWAAEALAKSYLPGEAGVDFVDIMSMLDKAIAADAKNTTAYLWRATFWLNLGYFDRAIADTAQCLRVDPAYLNCTRWQALAHLFAGRDDEAMALFEQGVAKGFVTNRSDSFLPLLVQRGDRVGARLLMERLGTKPELAEILMDALAKPSTPPADAKALVERNLPESEQGVALRLGHTRTYVYLGAYDLVLTAGDNNSDELVAWERYPPGFRNSPAFKQTLEHLGVPKYWRAKGFPPQCRAVGDKDFSCDPIVP